MSGKTEASDNDWFESHFMKVIASILSISVGPFTVCPDPARAEEKPRGLLIVGTVHESPEPTMPIDAGELERFGFHTTVVPEEGNLEKKSQK